MESNKVKKNKQKLKESEEKYRLIIESIPDPLHVVDVELKIIYINPAFIEWLKTLGLNPEIIGKTPAEAFPFVGEKVTKEYQEVFNSKKEQFLEAFAVLNNKRIFTETKKIPILKSGKVIQIITIVRDVTERKEFELKLRESEEKYRLITENANDLIAVLNKKFEHEYINELTYRKILGYSNEDMLGKTQHDIIHPEDYKIALKILKDGFKKGEGTGELRLRHKNGNYIWVETKGRTFKGFDGLLKAITTSRDITERKLSEQSLKESEEKYRYFFNNAQVGLFWSRISDGKFLECNDTFAKLVGYNIREECLADYIALEHYLDLNRRNTMLEKIRINNEIKDFEIQVSKKDGTLFWASISALTDLKENRIEGAAIDITERKNAEQKLKVSEIKYRHLFETSPYFIGLVNSENILIDCNDAINDLLSIHTREDIIGKNFKEFFLLNMKNTHLIPIFEKAIKSIFEGVNQEGFDFRLNRAIGGHLWIHVKGTLIEIEKQKLIQFIMQDITERKRSEQLLRETIEDLARINTELEQFTYIASHDLQEPLRMIISFIQLLEKRYKDKLAQDANDFIAFVVDGAKRMQDLINSLLKYSRIGKPYKGFENVDLNDVLKDVIDNLKQLINETNAEVIYDPLPTLMGNEVEFIQLLQNLISNAIKFHKEEEPPVVHISAKLQKNQWIFSVRDNGIGIDPKDFERIFIIFQRLHTKDEFGGTGIGLAICRKIIEFHSGKIWVKSEVGKGSTFYFSIPKEIDIKVK